MATPAERYGWINRALPADRLSDFVRSLAHRIASFPAAGHVAGAFLRLHRPSDDLTIRRDVETSSAGSRESFLAPHAIKTVNNNQTASITQSVTMLTLSTNFSWFEREFFGSSRRTRTYNPWVNSVRALLLKMRDLSLVSGEKTQSPAARIWSGPRVPA
jgi:hypothetical protein